MTTQIRALRSALENVGWKIVEVETNNLDWWADEVWILERKSCETLYLAFIVDPMFDGVRKKGEHLYCVTASSHEPRRSSTRTLYLRRGWQNKLTDFIQNIATTANDF